MEPLLSLPPDQFRAALAELQLDPQREADLVRQYRRANSPLAPIFGLLDRVAGQDAGQGMQRASMVPVARPEGMSVAEAVRSGEARLAVPQGVLDAIGALVGGIDAPGAAARGLIPAQDMPAEALGTAGVAMGGGGLLSRPAGSFGMGGRVAAETPAQRVARLLREGRASEVTDDLMAQADPQEMYRLYVAGETGMDLPMDRQSRFQRAREMGFDVDNILYHGTAADFPAFDASRGGSVTGARSARSATWLSDSPDVAESYAAFAADKAVQDLIDRSYRAEVDGDFNLAERLMREAQRVEAAGVEGANIISVYGPRNLRRVDMAGDQYDPDDMSLSGLLSQAQQSGASGLELTDFIDNADFANMTSATHRGIFNPVNIRSEFARFDPRLSHLANLNAANVSPITGLLAILQAQEQQR